MGAYRSSDLGSYILVNSRIDGFVKSPKRTSLAIVSI